MVAKNLNTKLLYVVDVNLVRTAPHSRKAKNHDNMKASIFKTQAYN
jgi:hypothetical protein